MSLDRNHILLWFASPCTHQLLQDGHTPLQIAKNTSKTIYNCIQEHASKKKHKNAKTYDSSFSILFRAYTWRIECRLFLLQSMWWESAEVLNGTKIALLIQAKPPYDGSSHGLLAAVGFKSKAKRELTKQTSIRKPIGQMTLEDLNQSGNTSLHLYSRFLWQRLCYICLAKYCMLCR